MAVKFNMQGMDKLVRRLKGLERGVRNQAARRATAKAATHLRDRIKPRIHRAAAPYVSGGVPHRPGDLEKTLIVKHLDEAVFHGYFARHKVVFRRNVEGGIGNIAHLIDGGVRPHDIPIGKGPNAGRVFAHPCHPAYPFFVRTLDAERTRAYRIMHDSLKADLAQLWQRG